MRRWVARASKRLLLAFICLWGTWYISAELAERALPRPLFDRPHSPLLLDASGELLEARVAEDEQWRFPPPAGEGLPPRYERALLSFEDKRFYHHHGVDLIASLRALWQNLRHGRVVSGASTISMQVVRLALKSPERGLKTKLYETWLALGLERRFSKAELLTLYRAHAPFGGNIVGLDAASWRYFGRAPQHLTWAEGATLAVLPNQPGLVHLKRNRARLKAKRDALLRTLYQEGALSELDLTLSLAEPLPTLRAQLPQLASHLLDTQLYTLRQTARNGLSEDLRAQAQSALRAGRLQTNLNGSLQRALSSILARHGAHLNQYGIDNASALVLDNSSLQPVVYLGNLPALSAPTAAHLDLITRARSTGSTLKPILYASALDSGLLAPSSLLPDYPLNFGGFRPLNADRRYRGAVQAHEALTQSLNIPFVQLALRYGVPRFLTLLKRLGLQSLTRSAEDYGATLIIGGAEASLGELTLMYATLAHALRYPDPSRSRRALTEGVKGWDLQTSVGAHRARLDTLPLSRGAIWLTFEALTEVARPAEYAQWRQLKSAQRVAWKTGTSQGFRDAWAIGVTPRYTVGVWVGNASGEGRPQLTGSRSAAPLLFELLSQLDGGGWFEQPPEALREVTLCKDSGYLPAEGCETERAWLPKEAPPLPQDPYHKRIHLDREGRHRVTSACYPIAELRHESRLILPPTMALYYQRAHSGYRGLPPMLPSCVERQGAEASEGLSFVYPKEGAKLYLPRELNGARGGVVFKVAMSDTSGALYWHLDQRFMGHTRQVHELALSPSPGVHELTVVSERGAKLVRRFEILTP